ncbi:hypothetical protein FB561_2789 [Kribbella amoyensis]|uniref:Uncharacterized protein n=1 Tax=Kribbella amoyensis TaxID=996641 RepID=A0A561BS80_9ACTN|nr:hypothetical protein [Kribbella amoyensis]TWD81669.1 hypothetical protein FB561_2789 [Kribbella amoyensis]
MADADRANKRLHSDSVPVTRTIRAFLFEHPFASAALLHVPVIALAAVGFTWDRPFLPHLAPENPSDVLQTAWQVHSGFVAIAFAGLVMLIDMAGRESLINPIHERRFLLQHTFFLFAFSYSLLGAIELGVATAWFDNAGVVFILLLTIVTWTILLIGNAYARAIRALTEPGYTENAQRSALVAQLRASMDASRAMSQANTALHAVAPRTWSAEKVEDATPILHIESQGRLADVHIPSIRRMQIELTASSAVAQSVDPNAAPESANHSSGISSPPLVILASIGQTVDVGRPLFVLRQKPVADRIVNRAELRLKHAVRLEQA